MLVYLCLILIAQDPTTWNEVEWARFIAVEMGGKTEVKTPDGSRVDLVVGGIAYEIDWCTKQKPYKHWQAPSQATFYAIALNLKPGVILLFDGSPIAQKSYLRCLVVCSAYGIELKTWKVP